MSESYYFTPHEEKFENWLNTKIPYLVQLWDFKESRYIKDRVDEYLAVCSSGQALMCCFALQVWSGGFCDYSFDLLKAMRILDDREIKIIQEWVEDPWCC